MVLTLSDEQLELHGPKLKDAVAIVTGAHVSLRMLYTR
jgi:hypothetical protein